MRRSIEMTRRHLGTALALSLSALGWAPSSRAAEVAVLKSTDAPAWRPAIEALKKGTPGHTVTEYDLRGERAEAERVLGTLKAKQPILVGMGPLAAQAAKEIAPDIALVYCMVQDPAKAGLVNQPNVAGVAFSIPVKNQLAAFRAVYPRGVRVGVIYADEVVGRQVQEAQKAASVVRLALVTRPVTSEREIPQALRTLLQGAEAVDALWMPPDPVLLSDETRRFLLAETLKAAKPIFSFSPALVAEGALVSNGPDFTSIGEQVAEIVTRIAAGEKGGRIALMIPRAELVINRKIAERLKIEIPADALKQANKLF
jgi:putative ABC transport system substrate-binding protein